MRAKISFRAWKHSFSLIFIFCNVFLFSQNEKGVYPVVNSAAPFTGKTYAVIIGISHYQSSKLPQLEYADKDARAFSDFLISPAGGKTDSANIKLLLNENAKCANIWAAIGWLGRVVQKGDKAFIYFSGHGDAIDERESFLLAYDAPGQDPNLYLAGGVIQIYNLKNRIHDLVNAKGAQVLFITDACRTNEIPGGQNGSGYAFKKIMEDNEGEIQFNSCSANEASQEGIQWGNGRGVFSWYLINGMMGLADEDDDGIVTLYELQSYVSSNVRKETKSASTGKPKQSPSFCCTDKNDLAIANVNKDEKNKAMLSLGKNVSPTNAIAKKGVFSFTDTTAQKTYDNFSSHIQKKEFYSFYSDCAFNDLNTLRNFKSIPEEKKFDLIDIYVSAVMNNVQEELNSLLDGKLTEKAADSYQIQSVLDLVSLPKEEMQTIKGNYYFFKGWEYCYYSSPELLNTGLLYCDSAIQIMPNAAYIYDIQGLIYQAQKKYDEAQVSFKKAIQLAPNWTFALGNLGHNYSNLGDDSTALILYDRVLKLDSTLWPAYNNIGAIYFHKWRISQDENYKKLGIENYEKAIFYDSTSYDAYYNLSLFYEKDSIQDKYVSLLLKAFHADSTRAQVLQPLAEYYYDKEKYSEAAYYFGQWYYVSSDPIHEYNWGVSALLAKEYDYAIRIFLNYCDINVHDSDGFYMLGKCYYQNSNYDTALYYFKTEEKINPNRVNLIYYTGMTYKLLGNNQKAIPYFRREIKTHPNNASACYYELSLIYSEKFLGKRKSKRYWAEYEKLKG
ncbi:MAG: caspase family protein [Bacteroidetes bacterium]|nr:caspase family protein [Bacteroidota bacterium]